MSDLKPYQKGFEAGRKTLARELYQKWLMACLSPDSDTDDHYELFVKKLLPRLWEVGHIEGDIRSSAPFVTGN